MKINYSYSAEQPSLLQSIGTATSPKYQVNFDTEALNQETDGQTVTTYRSLYVQVTSLAYDQLVAAIIQSRYTSNDIEAIMLNNMAAIGNTETLTTEKRAEYVDEYTKLQAWRAHAKEVASEVCSL
jgi:hypothetical protein